MFSFRSKQYISLSLFFVLAGLSLLLSSCFTIIKEAPPQPFVYQTKINIEGKYTTDEKKLLLNQLNQQLHDSVQPPRRSVIFWEVLKKPPVYDSLNAAKSKGFMSAMLNSLGYYRDSIAIRDSVYVKDGQQRVYLDFDVLPGQLVRLDSVWYNLRDSVPPSAAIDTLQHLTDSTASRRLLSKGEPFSKSLISSELDRLADLYRDNGFLRFNREQLIAVWDTIGSEALRITFDPVEQARQLELLQERIRNPRADVQIRLKSNPDFDRLKRYHIGRVTVYPDFNLDSSVNASYEPQLTQFPNSGLRFVSYKNLFKTNKLIRFVYLRPGELYRQRNYLATLNKFNSLSAWRLVTINPLPRANEDSVDIDIRLIPATTYIYNANFELSRNTNVTSLNLGSLLGLGFNLNRTNRNFAKSAAVEIINARYGIELGSNSGSGTGFIQTQLASLSYNIQFPRIIPRYGPIPFVSKKFYDEKLSREDARTTVSANVGLTDRRQFYRVGTVNVAYGYDFRYRKWLFGWRPVNIEYNYLQRGSLLDALIDSNQSFATIFANGLILSGTASGQRAWGKTLRDGKLNIINELRLNLEVPSPLPRLFPNNRFLDTTLYRFIKLDAEFVRTRKIRRTAFAMRGLAGIGYQLNWGNYRNDRFLPFFRQYFAGGPNSMRAWAIRRLGPGSTVKSFLPQILPDRFGDIRLEFNAEYRFFIGELFGFPLESALFTDIGNVWFLRENENFPDGNFRFEHLYRDIAVGMGTGIRWDFGFLKARADFAWKAKDPSPDELFAESRNRWFYGWRLGFSNRKRPGGAQFQLGINYPF